MHSYSAHNKISITKYAFVILTAALCTSTVSCVSLQVNDQIDAALFLQSEVGGAPHKQLKLAMRKVKYQGLSVS